MRNLLFVILAMAAITIVACDKTDDLPNDSKEIIDDNEDAGVVIDVDTTWNPGQNVDI